MYAENKSPFHRIVRGDKNGLGIRAGRRYRMVTIFKVRREW